VIIDIDYDSGDGEGDSEEVVYGDGTTLAERTAAHFNIAAYDSGDWPKATLDFASENVEDLAREIEDLGWTVEKFKTLPAYRAALATGNYPWLKDL
jgi:hypothetical protein